MIAAARKASILGAIMFSALLGGCVSFHRGALPNEPKSATFMQLDQARVRYSDAGQGPPVVLLHGFASSMDAWATVAPELAKNHRVVRLDLKGFGWTDRPPGDYSPRAQAKLVYSLLDKLGVKQAALVAHSWGSSVALSMALMAPERVERIALYDAWVYERQLPTTFLWARGDGIGEMLFGMYYKERPEEKISFAFFDQKYVTQALVDTVYEQLDRPGTTAAALAAVRGQRFSEMETHYRDIKQPTLLLWGREDRVTRLEFGERLSQEMPNAKLVVYPRCGHFPMIEAAAPSTRELAEFLATSTAAPAHATVAANAAAAAPDVPATAPEPAQPATQTPFSTTDDQ